MHAKLSAGTPRQDHWTSRETLLAVMDLGAQNRVLGRMWEVPWGYTERQKRREG